MCIRIDENKHIFGTVLSCLSIYLPYWICKKACVIISNNAYAETLLPYSVLALAMMIWINQTDFDLKRLISKRCEISLKECIATVVFQSSSGYCLLFVTHVILRLMTYPNGYEGRITGSTLIVVVLLAPLTEELIFRWLLYERLRIVGYKKTVLIISIMFALLHVFSQGITEAIYVFWLSLIWCRVKEKYDSYLVNVALHTISNIWCGVIPIVITTKTAVKILYLLMNLICLPLSSLIVKKGNI